MMGLRLEVVQEKLADFVGGEQLELPRWSQSDKTSICVCGPHYTAVFVQAAMRDLWGTTSSKNRFPRPFSENLPWVGGSIETYTSFGKVKMF